MINLISSIEYHDWSFLYPFDRFVYIYSLLMEMKMSWKLIFPCLTTTGVICSVHWSSDRMKDSKVNMINVNRMEKQLKHKKRFVWESTNRSLLSIHLHHLIVENQLIIRKSLMSLWHSSWSRWKQRELISRTNKIFAYLSHVLSQCVCVCVLLLFVFKIIIHLKLILSDLIRTMLNMYSLEIWSETNIVMST